MQSDTFLNDTDSDDEEYSSDSSGDLPKNNNIGTLYEYPKEAAIGERFIDQSSQEKYLGIRNELFTQPTETVRICFYTNYKDGAGHGYKNEVDLIDKYKVGPAKNVIGFELISADIKRGDGGQAGIPFVDLIIPEIPHKACRVNELGIPIISRLRTVISDTTNYYGNEPQKSYRNYFSPIKLHKLTLKLLKPTGAEVEASEGYSVFYEFEATILKRSLSER